MPQGGVAGQISLGSLTVSDERCEIVIIAGEQAEVPTANVAFSIGDILRICLRDSSSAAEPDATVVGPDGRSENQSVENDDYFTWTAELGQPIGVYRVIFRAGAELSSGAFSVRLPRQPTVIDALPGEGPPGTAFRVGLAGFPAGEEIPLDAYRFLSRDGGGADAYEFISRLPPARVDGRGEAHYTLVTQQGDPAGAYCIVPRGYDWETPLDRGRRFGCAGFTVR